jgi:hypothetical protein
LPAPSTAHAGTFIDIHARRSLTIIARLKTIILIKIISFPFITPLSESHPVQPPPKPRLTSSSIPSSPALTLSLTLTPLHRFFQTIPVALFPGKPFLGIGLDPRDLGFQIRDDLAAAGLPFR